MLWPRELSENWSMHRLHEPYTSLPSTLCQHPLSCKLKPSFQTYNYKLSAFFFFYLKASFHFLWLQTSYQSNTFFFFVKAFQFLLNMYLILKLLWSLLLLDLFSVLSWTVLSKYKNHSWWLCSVTFVTNSKCYWKARSHKPYRLHARHT